MTALTGIVHNLPDAEYFAHDSLSSTGARRLLDSPARYRWEQDHPQKARDAFDVGHAVHTKVLGTGSTVITYPEEHLTPSGNASTKAATLEWVEEQRASGLVVISAGQLEVVDGMAEAVLAHPTARLLFEQDGHPETSLFAEVDGVECRARFDWYARIGVDLKTTAGRADKHGFSQSVARYGYDVQDAWYRDVREAVTDERGEFIFAVVEKDAPYLVGVHQLDRDFVDLGRAKARRARQIYTECTTTNSWPGYPEPIQLVVPPVWAINDAIDKELA